VDKKEFTQVLQASLLLYDGMPEEKVVDLVGKRYVSLAQYIVGFVRSYKLQ